MLIHIVHFPASIHNLGNGNSLSACLHRTLRWRRVRRYSWALTSGRQRGRSSARKRPLLVELFIFIGWWGHPARTVLVVCSASKCLWFSMCVASETRRRTGISMGNGSQEHFWKRLPNASWDTAAHQTEGLSYSWRHGVLMALEYTVIKWPVYMSRLAECGTAIKYGK